MQFKGLLQLQESSKWSCNKEKFQFYLFIIPTGYYAPVENFQQPTTNFQQPAMNFLQPVANFQQPAAKYSNQHAQLHHIYQSTKDHKGNIRY
jgi:hypothetical protein